MQSKYCYRFLVSTGIGEEKIHRHYEEKGLTEQDISEIEEKIMEASDEDITCMYIGEGYE